MKRLAGLVLTVLSSVPLIWGGLSVLSGSAGARISITDDFSVTALTGGLIGVTTFTLGLIWLRD
ncbi:hypothetical protein GobsT_15670 [Gemmata obscuriglobus]|uniref:Uncharacterized protein n=1 Tax=Gemmata obscuriglobus TaxID=114 RepID=A0A2Z3HE80_9BACT|nr:hypothetical protein [Gemmata obscuriglobus]AWM40024.1 hypothetical protein C1280_25485 [Gemmata obscuriglobus]QEG26820.1 hypothetical protein GobsT_15670 [Gemmata obscuriglobus]VTS02750.1 unnamed protein product [Gemmata obscuriglobus UQM 2246]